MPTHDESDETMEERCPFCKSTTVKFLEVEASGSKGGSNMGHYRCLRAGCGKEFELPRPPG